MPGEMNRWTLDALREYLLAIIERHEKTADFRFRSLEATMEDRFEAMEKAVVIAERSVNEARALVAKAIESELRHVNEFRELVEEIQEQQMPRLEIVQRIERLSEKIDKEVSSSDSSRDRGVGAKAGWALAIAVAMFAIAVASFFRR